MPDGDATRRRLIAWLQTEHANERAAAFAYAGHAASVADPAERREIARIEAEEWHHRERLGVHLAALGAAPSPWFEALIGAVGRTLGALCHVTGWLAPMLGAGWIERRNSLGYFAAADVAREAGLPALADELVSLGAAEVAHHAWFHARVRSHALGARLPLRDPPVVPAR